MRVVVVGVEEEMVNNSSGCCANLINIPRFALIYSILCSDGPFGLHRIPCDCSVQGVYARCAPLCSL